MELLGGAVVNVFIHIQGTAADGRTGGGMSNGSLEHLFPIANHVDARV